MNQNNPTHLRLGMKGELEGKSYQVAGRVVMGVLQNEELYYWNEFNLRNAEGQEVTLVYETTQWRGEWRWFVEYQPARPMSAAEAAKKYKGETVDLGDGPLRVTLVGHSRVYFIEGMGPEGVKVGDQARYFNAEAGDKMAVVSWTGEEVEFYQGVTLPQGMVEKAFHIPPVVFKSETFLSSGGGGWSDPVGGSFMRIAGVGLVALIVFGLFLGSWRGRRAAVVKTYSTPAPILSVGQSGDWEGKHYRVTEHVLGRIQEEGIRFEQHEFKLRDSEEHEAMLVVGSKPGGHGACLYTPLSPAEPMRPEQAGAARLGEIVNVDGVVAPVTELFCEETHSAGDTVQALKNTSEQLYGFAGQTNSMLLLVRWKRGEIQFYRGEALSESKLAAAFQLTHR